MFLGWGGGDAEHGCDCTWIRKTVFRGSNRSRGLTANTIELMVLVHRSVVHCVIRDVLRYIPVGDCGIGKFNKAKNVTL